MNPANIFRKKKSIINRRVQSSPDASEPNLIISNETDDPVFVEHILRIIKGVLSQSSSRDVWIVKLNNWFDHKWLGFWGHGPYSNQVSLKPLRLPSFHPNRILSERYWARNTDGELHLPKTVKDLHPKEYTGWEPPLNTLTESGVMIWFSGNSKQNGRGSLMVYVIEKMNSSAWYASFSRNKSWAALRLKGISKLELEQLANPYEASDCQEHGLPQTKRHSP